MSQLNCSTASRKGKHLTYEERIKLETLCKLGLAPACIAEKFNGRNVRTLKREIARGQTQLLNSDLTERQEYSADVGQQEHDRLGTAKGPSLKIGKDYNLVVYLEKAIGQDGQSPYAAIQAISNKKLKFDTTICYKTV